MEQHIKENPLTGSSANRLHIIAEVSDSSSLPPTYLVKRPTISNSSSKRFSNLCNPAE
jgi:hypothetical protein